MRRLALLLLLSTATACAPKVIPPPVVTAPKFPDFMVPSIPASFASSAAAASQDRGWRFLQAGDFKNAEREFEAALKTPGFYPAESGLGYLELARNESKSALSHFDRALEREKSDLAALVGRGRALMALNREADALQAFEAALAVDPSLTDLARQVAVLRFRSQQEGLNQARQAARAGRFQEALAAYDRAIAGSPESAFLYRERGGIEREQGQTERALEDFRKAVALDAGDVRSLIQIGDILESQGDLEGAARTYADAEALDGGDEARAKLETVRARLELARLPEEYRAIEQAPQITRGDLAALIGVRLSALLHFDNERDAVLITDLRDHWAATWIMAAARAGVMEPYANHAFQPQTVVRRVDFAQVVSRLLDRLAALNPGQPGTSQAAGVRFPDVPPGHLAFPAVSAAVASGVMTTGENGAFQPSRIVTGAEAVEAIDRIDAMRRGGPGRGKNAR
jgi:tetratricopeptide (TPR) repeat protein